MERTANLDGRISVLEAKMEWSTNTVQKIEADLDILKQNHCKMFERFNSLDERIFEFRSYTEKKIYEIHSHMEGRTNTLQTGMDEKFSALRAHTVERFIRVEERIADIHRAIVTQTRWILAAILGGATIFSTIQPLFTRWMM
jgi:flagellar biosynthesis chaperone FliJ